jgi:hypothetical protein
MPKEAVMTRNTLLARCSAAAAAAMLLAGLAAAPAMARPDPGEPTSQIELAEGSTKAQIEHDDQLYLGGRTKAQIEHDEQLSVPSTGGDNAATSSSHDAFPWAFASLAAAGLAAVTTAGVVMQRQRKSVLAGA